MPDAAGTVSQMFWPDITTESTFAFTDDMFAMSVDAQREHTQGSRNDVPAAKTRKPKAPTLRDSDWEPHKPLILELYSQQNMDAQSVQRALLDERGFFAELRQYETILKKWKLGKYIKHREMAAIVRKTQQRELIETDKDNLGFEVRGKPVEMERIHRWMRTHGVASDDLYIQSPPAPTPSDVYCRTVSAQSTPVPSPTYAAASPALPAEQPSILSPLQERILSEICATTQIDSIGPGAASLDYAEPQDFHDYLMGGSQPDAVLGPTTNARPILTDGCIQMDYATPNLPNALESTAQGSTCEPNGRTDPPSMQSDLEDALDLTGAESTASSGTLQRRAYLEKLLQQITTWLSQLEGLQQILQTLEIRDDATPDLLEAIAKLLRQSRVAQFHLQEFEIRTLQALRFPVSADKDRAPTSIAAEGLADLKRMYAYWEHYLTTS